MMLCSKKTTSHLRLLFGVQVFDQPFKNLDVAVNRDIYVLLLNVTRQVLMKVFHMLKQ